MFISNCTLVILVQMAQVIQQQKLLEKLLPFEQPQQAALLRIQQRPGQILLAPKMPPFLLLGII
jgi:hypothetical protein